MANDKARAMLEEIIIMGPATPSYRVTLPDGRPCLLSTNGRLYPLAELERVAPFLTGRPVYHRHEAGTGATTHIVTADGNGSRVGAIAAAWWQAGTAEIRGSLRVTGPYWQDAILEAERAGRLNQWGFSVDIEILARPVTIAGRTLELAEKIATVRSVDLVALPACGGRFIGATWTPEQRRELEALRAGVLPRPRPATVRASLQRYLEQ
ncbi:MAG: hypothetical protein L0322_25320 [Chloroflexi bacterium]|nr:hypothetical protein [Chloroflexota bacterium]MCI0644953.1 hypothetical protein [Chloroflexota bacterium]